MENGETQNTQASTLARVRMGPMGNRRKISNALSLSVGT